MKLVQEIPWQSPLHYFQPFAKEPWAILLHSANTSPERGRYSFIGIDPFHTWDTPLDFDVLNALITQYPLEDDLDLPPFQTGIMGLWGYEMLHTLEKLPLLPYQSLPIPDMLLGFYDLVIAFDHQKERAWIFSSGLPEKQLSERKIRAEERLQWLLHRLPEEQSPPAPYPLISTDAIISNFSAETYEIAVKRTLSAILNGDFFEANISQQFQAPRPAHFDPWSLYYYQVNRHQAPFSAYFSTPYATIVSFSPERFIECRQQQAFTHPIKGTAPRSSDPLLDQQWAQHLLLSLKDRAENIMIVDLMRNDFSRVCLPHSVQVPRLCGLESFKSVHHLVSTVSGTLAPNRTPCDLLKACFPGGSITGAPKIEVMKHIQSIEKTRRGPYCGSIGYLGLNNTLDTSIVIRTYTISHDTLYFQTGGAVTLDSDPKLEYEETLHKARFLIQGLTEPV